MAMDSCSSGLKQAGRGTGVTPTNLPTMESCAPPPNFYLTSGALTAHLGRRKMASQWGQANVPTTDLELHRPHRGVKTRNL